MLKWASGISHLRICLLFSDTAELENAKSFLEQAAQANLVSVPLALTGLIKMAAAAILTT